MSEADRIYFDNNASTPLNPDVLAFMLPFFSETCGNPSSVHCEGRSAMAAVKAAASSLASALGGVNPDCIVFTDSGSEANSIAIAGYRKKLAREKKGVPLHFVTSSIEHSSVLELFRYFESLGDSVTYVEPEQDGRLNPDAFSSAIKPETVLVSVMLANNETGVIQPFLKIIRDAHAAGVPVHSDAVQAFGKMPLDIIKCPADMISFSSHKINGPKGAGALYVKRNIHLDSVLRTVHSKVLKPGTMNVPAIAGFGKAAEYALRDLEKNMAHAGLLKEQFISALRMELPGALINGSILHSLPNTVNVSFPGFESAYLVEKLDESGLAVSAASACASSTKGTSHVLRAMNLPQELLNSAIRFSFGIYNTDAELAAAVRILKSVAGK